MKVHVKAGTLSEALRCCAPFVSESHHRDHLRGHVMLQAEDGHITMTANAGVMMVEVRVDGAIERPGECTFSHRHIAPVVDRMAWNYVAIGADADVVTVAVDEFRCDLLGSDADGFPRALTPTPAKPGTEDPADEAAVTFTIGSGPLRAMLEAVHDFMGTDATRHYLQGVYLCQAGDSLRAVATDGHRLAFIDGALPDGAAGMRGWIIPRPVVAYLRKHMAGTITVWQRGNIIRLTMSDGITLSAKLIDFAYPDYARVVPPERPSAEGGCLVVQSPMELARLLTDVIAGDEDTLRPAAIELDDDGLLLRLDGQDGIVTNCTLRIPQRMATWEGAPPPHHARFQIRYLRDLFKAAFMSPGRCILQPGADASTAALLRRGNVTGAVMPMRRTA